MTYYKTLPNAQERELAANFYYEVLPAPLVTWIKTGVELREFKVDEDVIGLADLLASYRARLTRENKDTDQRNRYGHGRY